MILITGASGFLGKHLTRFLSQKNLSVRALYYNHPPDADMQHLPGVEWMRCDLLDIYDVETAMQGITEIYHCAAIISFHPEDREKMLHFNPESTANVVNQALENNVRKLVHFSSVAAIGKSETQTGLITEQEEWGESTFGSAYGLSKHLAEMEVWRGIGEGLNAVIINPGIILGAGTMSNGLPDPMSLADRGQPFYTTGTCAWVDANDVVKLAYDLMQSKITAERFILSNDNYSYKEILSLMASAIEKKAPSIRVNNTLLSMGWRVAGLSSRISGKPAILTRETALSAGGQNKYDNSKIFGYFPDFQYTSIKATIAGMAEFYKKHNKANT